MFCNNCGNQIQEGERFCVKCGVEVENAAPVKCEQCGAEIRTGAKFCNECGAVICGHKEMFCSFCGQKFEDGDAFCKKCGNRVGRANNKPFSNIGAVINKNKGESSAPASKGSQTFDMNNFFNPAMILRLATLFFTILLLVLSIAPGLKIEMKKYSLFSSSKKAYKFSLINPFYDLDKIDSYFDDITAFGGVLCAIQCISILITVVMLIAPIFKKSLNTNLGNIVPIIVAACGFVYSITLLIVMSAVVEEELGNSVSVKFTAGGWMYVLVAISLLVLSIFSYRAQKKVIQ